MFKNYWAITVLGMMLSACGGPAQKGAGDEPWPTLNGKPPLIIAHRGASGYLPEHTLEAYSLAIEQGADVIEPDLVFTKDGVLVARHDRYLSTSTDVAAHPEFSDRKKANADPNDTPRDDWWVEDFTLEELKTLRAIQPFPGRSKDKDGLYEIPTFVEILNLVSVRAGEEGRLVGVYPETKHPGYFASIGLDFEKPLLAALEDFGAGPVFIQSFEPEILKRLKGKTDAKLVQLVYEETPGAGPNIPLTEIAEYADGVGPSKLLIFFDNEPTSFVADAQALGLAVHPWTFRADQRNEEMKGPHVMRSTIRLGPKGEDGAAPVIFEEHNGGATRPKAERDVMWKPVTMGGGLIYAEYKLFFELGVDGLFTDFPDTAMVARDEYATEHQ